MSFNLRWFPDGVPGKKPEASGVDIEWLACALAASNVDVVLLQEIKRTPRAQQRLAELVRLLDEHTTGRFRVELDACPIEPSQHVGILYDSARVQASGFADYASLNPHQAACQDQLRPGFGGYFRFPGGLDLHLLSIHLKSGTQRRDHELRLRSLAGVAEAFSQANQRRADPDLIIGGDWNTMGCQHCSPPISAEQELAMFRAKLASMSPALEWVPADLPCSQYHRGRGVLLDHFVRTRSVSLSSDASVAGFCGDLACQPFPEKAVPAGYPRLSDHCPVVLELGDVDDD